MKTFFGAVAIGIALIVSGVFFDLCIKKFSYEIMDINRLVEQDIYSHKAMDGVEKIKKRLDDKRILLASIINHESIDDIESCVTELKGYIDEGNYIEASVRCQKLMLLLERLPNQYGVSLQNIL